MPNSGEIVLILILVLFILLILFLIFRWFFCWYWKINARLAEQRRTNELLENIYAALAYGNQLDATSLNRMTGKLNNIQSNLQSGAQQPGRAPVVPPSGQVDETLPRL